MSNRKYMPPTAVTAGIDEVLAQLQANKTAREQALQYIEAERRDLSQRVLKLDFTEKNIRREQEKEDAQAIALRAAAK